MKNNVTCPACGYDNDFYRSICSSCKNYLRERVVNIDLWSTFSLLIENPVKAFSNIIFAEHKNFILFLIPLYAVKLLIVIRWVSLITLGDFSPDVDIALSYLIVFAAVFIYLILFAYAGKIAWGIGGLSTRFKDNLAVIIYSQLLFTFSLLILFPLEILILGNYLFSVNPSPFQIKGTIAFIFFSVELLVIFWSLLLLLKGIHVSTKSFIASILTMLIFILFLTLIVIILSKIVFTF